MKYSLVHWCTIWFNKVCSGLYVHLLTEAAVIFGMWHMLLTTSVAFDSLSDSNRLQSLHVRPLYLYHLFVLSIFTCICMSAIMLHWIFGIQLFLSLISIFGGLLLCILCKCFVEIIFLALETWRALKLYF